MGIGWWADDACHLCAMPPMRGKGKYMGLWLGYITRGGVQVGFIFMCVYLSPPPTPSHLFVVESVTGRSIFRVRDGCCIIMLWVFLFVVAGLAVVPRVEVKCAGATVGGAVGVAVDGAFPVGQVVGCVELPPCRCFTAA